MAHDKTLRTLANAIRLIAGTAEGSETNDEIASLMHGQPSRVTFVRVAELLEEWDDDEADVTMRELAQLAVESFD